MSRLSGMTDSNNRTIVTGVSYNAANQLLGMTMNGSGETRQYNSLNQLTNITGGGMGMTYNYPAGTNNGKVSSTYNAISGETVTYTYDSLNRIATANGSGWGQSYGFDSFGNLLSKTVTAGSGPSLSQAVNPANNQIVGQSYDANGNTASVANGGIIYNLTYDAENRLSYVYYSAQGLNLMTYEYDAQNRRVLSWSGAKDANGGPTGYTVNIYSPSGQMLQTFQISSLYSGGKWQTTALAQRTEQYFGSRRLDVMDRLGSEGTLSSGAYFPWGEPRGSQPTDSWNFATYWQDSLTGLDYAVNRYYSNAYGRFSTPDPYTASGGPADPQSWNRYAYTRGDPVNRFDPGGTCDQSGDTNTSITVCADPDDGPSASSQPGANPGAYMSCMSDPVCYASHEGSTTAGGSPVVELVLSQQWQTQNMALQAQAANALASLSPQCQSAIGASNFYKTSQNVTSLEFFNGTLATQGSLTENQVVGNGDSTMIGELVLPSTGTAGVVLTLATGAPSNAVILGALFYGATQAQQNAVLAHEALHSGTGLGDFALAAALNLSLPAGASQDLASQAISDFLANGCPTSMQNH